MQAAHIERQSDPAVVWPRWADRFSLRTLLYVVLILLLANLVLAPLVMVLLTAFNVGPAARTAGATLAFIVAAWSSPTTWTVLLNTAVFALGSMALSLVIGVFFAFVVERTDMPLKNLAYAVIPLSIAMPGLLYGIAWVLLLSPRIGLFNLALMGIFHLDSPPLAAYSMGGMIFVDAIRGVGVVFLMTAGIFRNMDASLEEAAQVAGASLSSVARRITLRLVAPGIMGAAIYALTGSLETFEIPAIMGLPGNIHVLATKIYLLNKSDDSATASAIGILFIVVALVCVALSNRFTRGVGAYSTVTGKAYRPRMLRLGSARYVAAAMVWVYLLVVVVAPLLVMVWASLLPYYSVPSQAALGRVSLDAYAWLVEQPGILGAVVNTILLALVAPTVTLVICTLVAWYVMRSGLRGARVLEALAFIPNSIPSIMIALALLYLFLTLPWRALPLYGTVWIIAIAVVTRYLPFGSRTVQAAMLQLHRDLEEAAQVGGVSWLGAMRRIVVPLLLPTLISGWVFVAIHAVRETTMALMLYSPSSRVVSLVMWDSWQAGEIGRAAAMGVVLMVLVGILTGMGRLVDWRRTRRMSAA